MRSGLRRPARALGVVITVVAVVAGVTAEAGAAASSGDGAIARSGVFVAADFPAGFRASAPSTTSHTDNLRLAKGVDGCNPYVTLQKTLVSLPQARSSSFGGDGRSISNEVDVFPSEKAASAALVLYAKPSVVGCLENIFEKQFRQDPDLRSSLDDVVVRLDRQDISGLGDENVDYEGSITLTGTDGSTSTVGIGSAAVRVGPTVDVVVYSTTGVGFTDVLTPAIDASVGRLRSALASSAK
ncbi:MAG TPA: hypothetical protein VFW97_05030 [Acidimicrobiia bacterium]|jgi:hypothetical protein|nr:hypothetical protein [Acidimicrobiia bacterium]